MKHQKGIYFEYKPASGSAGLGPHAYLVCRDGKGGERVIRGGSAKNSTKVFVDEITSAIKTVVGGNITVQADIPLKKSKDAYEVGDTPKTRHARKLDLGGRDPEKVWKNMAARVGKIGEAGVDYNVLTQNSNSVVRAALEAGKIDPGKVLTLNHKAEDFRGLKNNLAKPQGGFDNKPERDGADGAEKPAKISATPARYTRPRHPPATPARRSDAAAPGAARRTATRPAYDDAPVPQTPEGRAMMGQLLGGDETIGEIIRKDPARVTRPELDQVIASDAYRTPHDPGFKYANDFATAWFDNVYRGGVNEAIAERRVPRIPTPSHTPEGGTVSDAAFKIGNDLLRRSDAGGVTPEILHLQTALNGIDRDALPFKRDGVFGPKTNERLRTVLATNGAGAVRGAFFRTLA